MIPLSLKQFALAVGAEPKWVLNVKPRLGRAMEYTPCDARWVRLARGHEATFAAILGAAIAFGEPKRPAESGVYRDIIAPRWGKHGAFESM